MLMSGLHARLDPWVRGRERQTQTPPAREDEMS